MKKNYRRIFGYALIMCICAMILVIGACLSENRLENYQEQYNENMTLSQQQILKLQEQVKTLETEKAELEKTLDDKMSLGSDLVTSQQALSDLKDIYQIYKSGNKDKAKKQFAKIEPLGFDDATLSYYEILSDLLK